MCGETKENKKARKEATSEEAIKKGTEKKMTNLLNSLKQKSAGEPIYAEDIHNSNNRSITSNGIEGDVPTTTTTTNDAEDEPIVVDNPTGTDINSLDFLKILNTTRMWKERKTNLMNVPSQVVACNKYIS